MRIPIDTINNFWRSRTPVRVGHVDELRLGQHLDPPRSTPGRRVTAALHEQRRPERYVRLAPGVLVIHERVPYRVVEVREISFDLWPEADVERWKAHVQRWLRDTTDRLASESATWPDRPVVIVLRPDAGGEELHLRAPASYRWDVLPEHYATCRACGQLPPCRDEEIEAQVAAENAEQLRRMAIAPGACMGCGEAIGGRQQAVAFPAPNLWRLDLPGSTARFHAREGCAAWVDRYRRDWESAGKPGFVSAAQQLARGEG